MIYLDNGATSYKKPRSLYNALWHNTKKFSVNAGRGGHKYSIEGAKGIMETAEELCGLFSVSSTERIAFTYNATYALNMAIGGILKKGGHAVITQMEHNSVLRPVHSFGNYTIVKADEKGHINPRDVKSAIRPDTRLVVCTHASNVCGTIEPVSQIGKIVRDTKAVFLADVAQTAGSKPIDVNEMNIDMLAFSAHKGLLGPMGVGGLYVREGIELSPVITGGTGTHSRLLSQPEEMPDFLQSGTQNVPAIMSLAESIRYIKRITPEIIGARQRELAYLLIEGLMNIKGVKVYGITDPKQGDRNGTVLFNIDKMESGELCDILNDDYKIATRGGWHCAYPAHCALGSEKSGAVRASFGAFSAEKEAKKLIDAIYRISKKKF